MTGIDASDGTPILDLNVDSFRDELRSEVPVPAWLLAL